MSNSCRNLPIRHFVDCFNTNHPPTERFLLETLFEFDLCFTWAKYQDGFCITNAGYYVIIVFLELTGTACVPLVLCRVFLCRTGLSDMPLHIGFDQARLFSLISD